MPLKKEIAGQEISPLFLVPGHFLEMWHMMKAPKAKTAFLDIGGYWLVSGQNFW